MRALLLISSLAPGGAERVTVSLARALAERGEDVGVCTVATGGDPGLVAELQRAGVRRLDLRARRLADPIALLRLIRLLRKERPGVLHAHGQDAAVMAAVARRFTRIPLVITRHVLDEPSGTRRQRLRARAALRALRAADLVVAVSSAAADRLRDPHGIPDDVVRVVPNGLDLDAFDAALSVTTPAATRAALGLAAAEPVILLPAVLRPGKGHALLLDALPRIHGRVPEARVLFAGAGPLEAELRKAAEPHGDAVRFIGHREDIPALMAVADVVVLPSAAEALPTVLMEAAAAGTPVVATAVGGVPEVVVGGRTGLLVPPDRPRELADSVVALLLAPDRARALGVEARGVALERFGMDRFVERTLEVWREAVGGWPA